jgi:hypothetical protein
MSKFALSNFFLFFIFLFFFSPPPPLSLSSYPFIPIGSPSLITGAPESRCRSATRPPHLRPAAPGPGLLLPALPRPTPPPPAPLPHLLLLCGEPWVCLSCSAQPEGNGGKRGAEPDGATKMWLRLPFGSCQGLRHQFHTWSQCHFHRLGGLCLEPLVESEPEPSQTLIGRSVSYQTLTTVFLCTLYFVQGPA